jgi:type I restriction enzyme S subunit
MNDLKEYKFDKLYTMSSGISSKPEQAGHGAPFVSFSTIFNNYFLPDMLDDQMNTSAQEQETYSIKKGDIFLTRTSETIDELGMSCVAIKDYPNATFSGFVKRLRPTQDNLTYDKYMGFYLRSKFFRKTMTNNAIMTLRASLNEDIFSYLKLYLPDFETQKKNGDLLFLLSSKIRLNNRINAELEAMAKTLYNYWFVQFDFPDQSGKPYKTSGGKMEYNEVLKRKIPKGWKEGNLASSELTQIIDVGVEDFPGSKIYLSTSEVENTEIMNHTITESFESKPSRANMQPVFSSVWFARMKDTKKLILISEFSNEIVVNYILSTGFAGIKVPDYALYYVWNFINDPYFEEMKNKKATGSTQKGIINESICDIPLVVPDKILLTDFYSKTMSLYKKIYRNQRENYELTQLRDFLLPILMNGQVSTN